MCAKHEDCGGVSQNRDGSFECRATEFIKENGAVSFRKPRNFKSPVYTNDDVDPGSFIFISNQATPDVDGLPNNVFRFD